MKKMKKSSVGTCQIRNSIIKENLHELQVNCKVKQNKAETSITQIYFFDLKILP